MPRKPQSDTPRQSISVTVPPWVIALWGRLGRGNKSAGAEIAAEKCLRKEVK